MSVRTVVVPGIDSSGPDHWQSSWEQQLGATRIAPTSWAAPDLADWCAALERAGADGAVLVAHSLGCWATSEWIAGGGRPAGVLLVAPPDTAAPTFPAAAAPTFVPLTPRPLGIPALLLASSDDPYCSLERAEEFGAGWGVTTLDVGPLGHINSASGLGDWSTGRHLLTAFTAGLRR
ncbi:alpha/beta fold hydrolase [Nakamurella sp. YIM 132087]|uniref:Alpha/beta fold hydrolase n=1 Tax=Nakamurella alba TaxID=2665158 RepID=A0A7K1FLX7_9ACTN|nr:alpha/beta hydrolase [Nakamurella alba]MTD14243.1 alpha/beta fold hydrolase [Nakamurella alba]